MAPVVVIPDIDSKKESIKVKLVEPRKNGKEPISVRTIQQIKVKKKAETIPTVFFLFLNTKEILNPIKKQNAEIDIKIIQSVPS